MNRDFVYTLIVTPSIIGLEQLESSEEVTEAVVGAVIIDMLDRFVVFQASSNEAFQSEAAEILVPYGVFESNSEISPRTILPDQLPVVRNLSASLS